MASLRLPCPPTPRHCTHERACDSLVPAGLAIGGQSRPRCRGPALATLRARVKETGADAVFWNRRYEPAVMTREVALEAYARLR